jgi:methylthioribose-1-phosphate isomerase
VFNPAFDVTPVALVTSWVLDRGVFGPEQLASGALTGLAG